MLWLCFTSSSGHLLSKATLLFVYRNVSNWERSFSFLSGAQIFRNSNVPNQFRKRDRRKKRCHLTKNIKVPKELKQVHFKLPNLPENLRNPQIGEKFMMSTDNRMSTSKIQKVCMRKSQIKSTPNLIVLLSSCKLVLTYLFLANIFFHFT